MASAGLARAQGALAGSSIVGPRSTHPFSIDGSRLLPGHTPASIGPKPSQGVHATSVARKSHPQGRDISMAGKPRVCIGARRHAKGGRRTLGIVAAQATEQAHSDAADSSRQDNRAHLAAHREETHEMEELEKPLAEYMSLPASQYSVLDAERIERVDDKTFKCYVHRVKFFTFEVCPVLTVRVDEKPNGCSIRLLSCTLEGSPLVVAQNQKFSASMVNNVRWSDVPDEPTKKQLISDTTIDVSIEVPAPFRSIPVAGIEVTGRKVLQQLLRLVLPRFLLQLEKDYRAWASGDESRKPLGTGEL